MREKYESLSAAVLKDLAKARGIKGLTGMKKEDLVEAMLAQDEKEKAATAEKKEEKPAVSKHTPTLAPLVKSNSSRVGMRVIEHDIKNKRKPDKR